MALIKSISGIRGTIGGRTDDNLTPLDTVKFTSSYGAWLLKENPGKDRLRVVVGRDARISGPMVHALVTATLSGMGIDVIDLGLSTTPTVEMMVVHHQADGGIIITASHNPKQWNALKLLNRQGEFLDAEQGAEILRTAQADDYTYAEVDRLGTIASDPEGIDRHIEKVLALPAVDRRAIAEAGFKVVVDAVNSTGGIAIPKLLRALAEHPRLPGLADEVYRVTAMQEYPADWSVQFLARRPGRAPVPRTCLVAKGVPDGDLLLRELERRLTVDNPLEPAPLSCPRSVLFSGAALAGAVALCVLSHPAVGRLPQVAYFPCLGAALLAAWLFGYFWLRHRRGE